MIISPMPRERLNLLSDEELLLAFYTRTGCRLLGVSARMAVSSRTVLAPTN